jgi:AcrR family transcriptional regulator
MRQIAQREDIRDLILDGVDALLARYGFKKMTMEELAQAVGIGKGTIYLHFPSKDEVTLAHIDRIVDRVLAKMDELASSDAPFEERLAEMLIARVLIRFEAVRSYSQSLDDLPASLRKQLLARREIYFEKEARALARVVEAGRASGVFHVPDALAASRVLVWSTNAMLPYSLTPEELGRPKEIEERVAAIAALLIAGLARPPRERPEPQQRKKKNRKSIVSVRGTDR